MSLLYKIIKEFDENLKPYEYLIELENGLKIDFLFKKENLKHLLGFHKTRYKTYYPSAIYTQIKNKKITLEKLKTDKNYSDIETRVLKFSRIKDLLNLKIGDEIIEFDSSKLKNCKLKSKYMIFDDETGETLHLGLALGEVRYYPETWFTREKDIHKYINNQKKIKVIKITKKLKE